MYPSTRIFSAKRHVAYYLVTLLILGMISLAVRDVTSTMNASCPEVCTCDVRSTSRRSGFVMVDCSARDLIRIPINISRTVTEALSLRGNALGSQTFVQLQFFVKLFEIDLSFNNVTSLLPLASLSYTWLSLQHLDISNNLLEVVPVGALSRMPSVELLLLSNNRIGTLERNCFENLPKLRRLSLSGNLLDILDGAAFGEMPSLITLQLDSNLISAFNDPQIFSTMKRLENISLSFNQLSRLDENSFSNLARLVRIDLSHNHLGSSVIATRVFQAAADNLDTLILDGNLLERLQRQDFAQLNVRDISLSGLPRLVAVDADAFHHLPRLDVLRLHSNPRLCYIHPEAFNDVPRLRILYLHANRLIAIPAQLAASLASLEALSLGGNPLHCDCNARWLRQTIETAGKIAGEFRASRDKDSLWTGSTVTLQGVGVNSNEQAKMDATALRIVSLISGSNESQTVDGGISYGKVSSNGLEPPGVEQNNRMNYQSGISITKISGSKVSVYGYRNVNSTNGNAIGEKTDNINSEKTNSDSSRLYSGISKEKDSISRNCGVLSGNCTTENFPDATQSSAADDIRSTTTAGLLLLDIESMVCDSPDYKSSTPLRDIPLSAFSALDCQPYVLPLFNASSLRAIGESVTLDCRAIGRPTPAIHWILPNSKRVNGTLNSSRMRYESGGSLTLTDLKSTDYGPYACVALNTRGYDVATTQLRIYSPSAHLFLKAVSATFVAVAWNGTENTITSANYVIVYRQMQPPRPTSDAVTTSVHIPSKIADEDYGKVHVRPFMRVFTVTNLLPVMDYEFCLSSEHVDGSVVKLHCLQASTKRSISGTGTVDGLGTVDPLFTAFDVVIATLGLVVMSLLFVVCTMMFRRYVRRSLYEVPTSPSSSSVSFRRNPSSDQSRTDENAMERAAKGTSTDAIVTGELTRGCFGVSNEGCDGGKVIESVQVGFSEEVDKRTSRRHSVAMTSQIQLKEFYEEQSKLSTSEASLLNSRTSLLPYSV